MLSICIGVLIAIIIVLLLIFIYCVCSIASFNDQEMEKWINEEDQSL